MVRWTHRLKVFACSTDYAICAWFGHRESPRFDPGASPTIRGVQMEERGVTQPVTPSNICSCKSLWRLEGVPREAKAHS